MIKLDMIYSVEKNSPFFVFFTDNAVKEMFLKNYHPQTGFGIYRDKKGFKLYSDAYVFQAMKKKARDSEEVIGLSVNKYYLMNQRQTLDAVVKCVRVVGLDKIYFCKTGERTPKISQNGANDFFDSIGKSIDENQKHRMEKNTVIDSAESRQIRFLDEQEHLIEEKKKYEDTHLFSIPYTGYSSVLQNAQDGVIYKFNIGYIENENLTKKLVENTGVEIPANDGGMPIIGTIVELEEQCLHIKIHDMNNSVTRFSRSGEIRERMNPEYKFKIDALQMLRNGSSVNTGFLDALVDSKVKTYDVSFTYEVKMLNADNNKQYENVNPSQKEAIEKALSVEDFLLVQGPPGTGKTTIITEMIEKFVGQGLRVLICSKNNLAVDNVLEKCQALYYDQENKQKMQCLRLGNEEKIIPSVRGDLPRPLTQTIQDDIKVRSERARESYSLKAKEKINNYRTTMEETRTLCAVIKYFLKEKKLFQNMLHLFENSNFTVLLGSKREKTFLEKLNYIICKTEYITIQWLELLNATHVLVGNEVIQEYLKYVHNIFNMIQEVYQEVNRATFRYQLVLGKEKNDFLNSIKKVEAEKKGVIDNITILEKYRGNSVINLNIPKGEIQEEFIDDFQREIEKSIEDLQANCILLKNVLDEWHDELISDQASLEEALLQSVKIVGATCIGVNTNKNFKNVEYDVAIIDEAGQITMHDLLVPLVKAKKTILIGDHMQLPPIAETDFCDFIKENNLLEYQNLDTVKERISYEEKLNRYFSISLFEQLFYDKGFEKNKVMLDTQFRMHPDIATFISDNFYEGKYKSGVTAVDRFLNIANFNKAMYFLDTCNSESKYEDVNEDLTIHSNLFEAGICAKYLTQIIIAIENNDYETCKKNLKKENGDYDIGVITAYKAQISLIREQLINCLKQKYNEEQAIDLASHLTINTLDSFQGRDNQIIFYSFVRSNRENKIGFLCEVRRLNVMMTRAKSLLVMVGDSETLTKTDSKTIHDGKKAAEYYKNLIEYCKEKDGYWDISKAGVVNEET